MKIASYIILATLLLTACGPTHVVVQNDVPAPPPPPPMEAPEVSYQSFYDGLSPYGQWIDYPGHGYVWMPSVGYGFKPYATNGHWVATDMGWTWASDYPWGWAAFHYGRWFFDNGYGWMWIPGQEWAPAWVSWRSSQDYYGWAPLGPNVGYNTGYYNPPANYWCFVPHQYVSSPHMNNYYVNEGRNVTIINNTTIINNYNASPNSRSSYRGGPAAEEVARYSGAPVRPMVVRENNRPGEQLTENQFNIYRPRVSSAPVQSTAVTRPAPANVRSLRDVRPTRSSGESVEPVSRNNSIAPPPSNINNNNPTNNRPSTAPAREAVEPVNRNNSNAPSTSNINNNNPANNRPATVPASTLRPENNNNSNNINRPVEPRPDNNDRYRNQQAQQPVNQRSVNPAPAQASQNNAALNRPAPVNQTTARPSTNNNNNAQRTNINPQNPNQHTVSRPSPSAHPAPQRNVNPTTNQNQKPLIKPAEKSTQADDKNK